MANTMVMYIFLNRGLGMSTGKAAAQAAHAAVLAAQGSTVKARRRWNYGGHYAKIILQGNSEAHLLMIQGYLKERQFKTFPVIDEGKTEIAPHQLTALGVEIADKANPHTTATFESFEVFRDKIKVTLEIDR